MNVVSKRGRRDRIGSLDGLRALAFTLVFAFHTWEFAGRPHIPVLTGVIAQNTRPDFFVALTGFLLMLPFARQPERLQGFGSGPYLRRRMRRIVLPYYAALVFAVLLPQVLVAGVRLSGGEADWQPLPSWLDWLLHLSFLHLFSPSHWGGINGSLWTMSLEMQLYLLFPLLIVLHRRWGPRVLVGALVVSLAYRLTAGLAVAGMGFPHEFLVGANALGRLPTFLAGMVCAVWVFRMERPVGIRTIALLLTGVVGGYMVAVSPLAVPWLSIREGGLGLAFASLIAMTVLSRRLGRLFGSRAVTWVGYRSYSFFLLHQPLMWFFSEYLTKMAGVPEGLPKLALLWTIGLALTMALGQVFFRVVEEPCLRWAKAVRVGPPMPAPRTATL